MRRFVLERLEDESGVSGGGFVAEGVEFTSDMVALTWRTAPGGLLWPQWSSVAVYPNMKMVEKVHGHGGKTVVRWLDDPPEHRLWCDTIRMGTAAVHCSCDLTPEDS